MATRMSRCLFGASILCATTGVAMVEAGKVRAGYTLACKDDYKKEIKCTQLLKQLSQSYALKLCHDLKSYSEKATITEYSDACKKEWRKLTCYSSFAATCSFEK